MVVKWKVIARERLSSCGVAAEGPIQIERDDMFAAGPGQHQSEWNGRCPSALRCVGRARLSHPIDGPVDRTGNGKMNTQYGFDAPIQPPGEEQIPARRHQPA